MRAVPVIFLLLVGCGGTAVSHGTNTALDSVNLVEMTDDMSRKIMGSAAVQEAIARDGRLRVVVQPVENEMTAEVLPRGMAEVFTGRLRTLLSNAAQDSFVWLMNRDDFYRLQGRERDLNVDLGPEPGRIQPEYALVARFRSITDERVSFRSSYYLCVYELTNIQTRQTLWADRYEVKKTAVKGFLD